MKININAPAPVPQPPTTVDVLGISVGQLKLLATLVGRSTGASLTGTGCTPAEQTQLYTALVREAVRL